MRSLIVALLLTLVVSGIQAKPMTPIIPPSRPDIRWVEDVRTSPQKYALGCVARKTVINTTTSRAVAAEVAPKGMPKNDILMLADQIAVMNAGKKVGQMYVMGTKLTVPIYKKTHCDLASADLRNWNFATYAGLRWGVAPAFLIAVRNHENPTNDSFALGVMHVKGDGIWVQYEQGAYVIKALIARRQHWDPERPTREDAVRCGIAYAEGSGSWGPQVWCQYRKAIGV